VNAQTLLNLKLHILQAVNRREKNTGATDGWISVRDEVDQELIAGCVVGL